MSHQQMFDQWSKQSAKVSLAPILELNSITTKLCAELFKQNIQAITELAQTGQEHLQTLAKAKGLDDALQTQTKFIAESTPQALKHAEQLIDTVLGSASEYREWFEHNMETIKQEGKVISDKFQPKVK